MLKNKGKYSIVVLLAVLMLVSCSTTKQAYDSKEISGTEKTLSGREKVAFDETYFSGLSAKYAGDDRAAIGYFKQCLHLDPDNTAVKYELSQLFARTGMYAESVEMAESIAEARPENRWYKENLASIYQSAKMYHKSAEVYEQLLESYPNELSYYYELGSVYLFANNATGAIRTYENLEALMGFENSLAEQLYKLYDHQKMYDKAEAKLKELIENNPTEIRYISMLAGYYKQRGEPQKAIDLYEKLKKEHPNDPYVKLALYEYYNEIGQSEKAFENLDAAFASKEVSIDAKVGILLALMDVAQSDPKIKTEVDDLLKILSKTHPDDPKSWAIYGDFLVMYNKKPEAREMFLKSIALDSSKYQVWNQVLFIDSELEDEDLLFEHSKACSELFPNQVLPHYFLGAIYMQRKEYKNAIKQLELAKDMAYGMRELEVQILGNLGDAYYQSGNNQKAWHSYDQALRIDPNNDYVLNNYAYFLSVEGENLEQAEKMSKLTIDRNPNSPTYLDTYGWILFKLNRYDEAVKYLQQANDLSGQTSGEILEHLGDAYFKTGEPEKALDLWKKAKQKGGGSDELDDKIKNKKL